MIKIGICGYGNLGKGVEKAVKKAYDMEIVGIFTRRDPKTIGLDDENIGFHISELDNFLNKIDVLILCGGSYSDLPIQTRKYAEKFNVIDSFDTHAKINEHFINVDRSSRKNNKTAIISVGWDPGLFSLNRVIMEAVLPDGNDYTFWGKGISQGHSDAIRRIKGVKDARQYTIPKQDALDKVRKNENPMLDVKDRHLRECYVVLEEDGCLDKVKKEIENMPYYFEDYETKIKFISLDELNKYHNKMIHGGTVIRTGKTTDNNKHIIEYKLRLDSNPEFSGSIMVAYARACFRLNKEGQYGCKTVLDIAPRYLSISRYDELLKKIM